MCKVLMVTGINKKNKTKIETFVKEMSVVMSVTEQDGVGYAAITDTGDVFGEKWLKPGDAFKTKSSSVPESFKKIKSLLGISGKFKKEISDEISYSQFGKTDLSKEENTVAVIMHTRRKTVGDVNVNNTHPFFEKDSENNVHTALIHNGSISNHDTLTKKYSTCDSEVILHEYLKHDVPSSANNIQEVTQNIDGEYAVGVLTSTNIAGKKTPILDVFKYKKDLYCAHIPELGVNVFATSDYNLERIATQLGYTIEHLAEISDKYFLRINAVTGERVGNLVNFDTYVTKVTPALPASSTFTRKVDYKKEFEQRHPELFTRSYDDVSKNLTPKEQALWSELELDGEPDHRALRLVNRLYFSEKVG